jgi:hypothetical protein
VFSFILSQKYQKFLKKEVKQGVKAVLLAMGDMFLKKVCRLYYQRKIKFLGNICFLGWQKDQRKEFFIY